MIDWYHMVAVYYYTVSTTSDVKYKHKCVHSCVKVGAVCIIIVGNYELPKVLQAALSYVPDNRYIPLFLFLLLICLISC